MYMRAQNSNERGLVTSYRRHATSQLVSVGDNMSDHATSTSCNWLKQIDYAYKFVELKMKLASTGIKR